MRFVIRPAEPTVLTVSPSVLEETSDFEILAGVLKKYKGAATEVVIPDGVVEIADEAFSEMKRIVSITIPDSVKVIGGKGLTLSPFYGCSGLKRINIPDTVESVGHQLFSKCKSLQEVDISTERLMAFSHKELYYCFNVYLPAKDYPYTEVLMQRIKQECWSKGICWKCRKPLILLENGRCKICGFKGNLAAATPS